MEQVLNYIINIKKYKYLSFILDQELSLEAHMKNLVAKLGENELRFFFKNRISFSLRVKKKVVTVILLPILANWDLFI